jgi:hypothetical protein
VTRAIRRVFAGGGLAGDEAAAVHGFELVGHRSTATWSPRS